MAMTFMRSVATLSMLATGATAAVQGGARGFRAVALHRDGASQPAVTPSYGSPGCPCIGIDNVTGSSSLRMPEGYDIQYPADFGSHCEAWENGRDPKYCTEAGQTPGKDKGWCAQSWCYVDPCNCNVPTPKISAALEKAKYRGKTLYYSYETCGSADEWTAANHKQACVVETTAEGCKTKPKCLWSGQKCMGKELVDHCATKTHGFTYGRGNCRCVGISGKPGTAQVTYGSQVVTYPADAGSSCKAWEQDVHPDCKNATSAPDWCGQEWCYVDPCKCQLQEPPKITSQTWRFQGKAAYYSYATCGAKDSWTAGEFAKACVNQKDADACTKLEHCGWTGSKCMGKELATQCQAPTMPPTTKSGASGLARLGLGALALISAAAL